MFPGRSFLKAVDSTLSCLSTNWLADVVDVLLCTALKAQKPDVGLSRRPSVRKIVKPKSKAQQEEEAAVSLATVVWDMTDRCAHRHLTCHLLPCNFAAGKIAL